MQLKIRRSQREAGVVSTNVVFCLDARVEFTRQEQASLQRYKLGREVLYNSEAQQRLLDRSAANQDGSLRGNAKSLALAVFAATKLYVTVGSLAKGQHIECKSLEELLGAEEALLVACRNLKQYLEAAATFDGREVLVDFGTEGEATLVAESVAPAPVLVTSSPVAPPPELPLPSATLHYDASSAVQTYDEPVNETMHSFGQQVRDMFPPGPEGQTQMKVAIGTGIAVVVLLLVSLKLAFAVAVIGGIAFLVVRTRGAS